MILSFTCDLACLLWCRNDFAKPLNDMWEFELHDVLHESELAVLSNWPVDTGTGALSIP